MAVPAAARLRQLGKALRLLPRRSWREGLRHGVGASIEHWALLQGRHVATVIDVGANKGQFSLLALEAFPGCRIHAFEPLAQPGARYRQVLGHRADVTLHEVAIAADAGEATIYVSGREDSSSLLPITERQATSFPGTALKETRTIVKRPLDAVLTAADLVAPVLLKIDVQGFELEVLKGSRALLPLVDLVYVECSFVELYAGQALAPEIQAFLEVAGLTLAASHNAQHGADGTLLQEDRLFARAVPAGPAGARP